MIKAQVLEKVKNIATTLNIDPGAVMWGTWLLAERVLDYPCLTEAQVMEVVYKGDTDQLHVLHSLTPAVHEAFTMDELVYVFTQLPVEYTPSVQI